MLAKMNSGTYSKLVQAKDNRFKYAFIYLRVSIKGFRFIRKVISLDGTHLKTKYKGVMLIASAQDGNFQIYPMAFGFVDSENDASWEWFLMRLRDQIPYSNELVFISDQNKSICLSIAKVYPLSHHGACRWHLGNNIMTNFKGAGLKQVFDVIADTYSKSEFSQLFTELSE